MGSQKNTITINGRVYDTRTGDVIDKKLPFKHVIEPTKQTSQSKNLSVDGVISSSKKSEKPQIAPSKLTKQTQKKVKTAHRHTPGVATVLHQKTERPKTLMRNTVNKPRISEPGTTTVALSGLVPQPEHKIIHSNIPKRSTRVSTVSKSERISRFSQNNTPTYTQKVESIPVRAAPRKRETEQDTTPPIHSHAPPIRTAPRSGSQDIFEKAMQGASSHQQSLLGTSRKHRANKRSRAIQIGAIMTTVFVLGSFFAYSNIPRIALMNAENNTGFAARVPSYKPTGFRLDRTIQYQPGKVVIDFKSNTDDRSFSITQEKTTLDNQALATNFSSSISDMVLTQTPSGTPIYIYDETNATWIKDGVQYNVQGTAQLSRNQLLNLASSL